MKSPLLIVAVACLLTFPAYAQKNVPTFGQYLVTVEKAHVKSIDFKHDPDARTFRTRLSEALKGGVNFGGHYVVAGWGCGTGCINGTIIDARTGRVFVPVEFGEIAVWYGKENFADEPVAYKKNSRLLVIFGIPGSKEGQPDKPPGKYYYEWTNDRLRLIKFVPVKMGE